MTNVFYSAILNKKEAKRNTMGYIGQSRSFRSQQAINDGLLTKTQLKAWQKRAVDSGVVKSCEWHHTGKFYNKTEYFDPADFLNLNPKDFPPKSKGSKEVDNIWYVLVSAQWGGTKKHPKIVGVDTKVTNKLTDRQKNANKYSFYGGYIKEFATEEEANNFANVAELQQ